MTAHTVIIAAGNPVTDLLSHFGVAWPAFLAALFNFALVAIILYYFALRPVLKTLDERNAKIEEGLKFSDEMRAKLADAEKHYEARIADAAAEAAKILRESAERARLDGEQKARDAKAEAEGIVKRAEAQAAREREKMFAELRGEVAQLVVETTEKILSRELSADEKRRFNTAAAKEVTAL